MSEPREIKDPAGLTPFACLPVYFSGNEIISLKGIDILPKL
jgi:hypothetical protein